MALKTSLITCVLLAALTLAVQPASAMYTNPVVSARSSQGRVAAFPKTNTGRLSVESQARGRAGFEWSHLGIGLGMGLLLVTGSTLVLRSELRRRPARG
jgi:hypothetical protein